MKKLGILGGMGPLAGAYFYLRLTAITDAPGDALHPSVLMISDTAVPDRTAHLMGKGPSPLPALADALAFLEAGGAEVVAIPCNTAHAYLPALAGMTSACLLDMPDLAVEYAASLGVTSLGVLSTLGCRRAAVYEIACRHRGIVCHTLDDASAKAVNALIYRHKNGEAVGVEAYLPYVEHLRTMGAETVILACTEISLAFGGEAVPGTVDALEILARRAVTACGAPLRKEVATRAAERAYLR